ncbi:MAG: prepilin-type N-terminal cleavage/methylation domain-containing protein [Patescibacteria group bacterium]
MMKKNRKGFTLIELLVVIAIIGLLATLAVVALNNARAKSRDARRISDVKQIQTALEMYYNDAAAYPAAITAGSAIATGSNTYMGAVPEDPQNTGSYVYTYANAGGTSDYTITFMLESGTGGFTSGTVVSATPSGLKQ